MNKITDHFKVNDKVEWITTRHTRNKVIIKRHSGTIEEIQGTIALIKPIGSKDKRRVLLSELKVIESKNDDPTPSP